MARRTLPYPQGSPNGHHALTPAHLTHHYQAHPPGLLMDEEGSSNSHGSPPKMDGLGQSPSEAPSQQLPEIDPSLTHTDGLEDNSTQLNSFQSYGRQNPMTQRDQAYHDYPPFSQETLPNHIHPQLRNMDSTIHPGFLTTSLADANPAVAAQDFGEDVHGNGHTGSGAMSISAMLSSEPETRKKVRRKYSRLETARAAAQGIDISGIPVTLKSAGKEKEKDMIPIHDLLADSDVSDANDDDYLNEKMEYQAYLRKRQADVEHTNEERHKRRRLDYALQSAVILKDKLEQAEERAKKQFYQQALDRVAAEEEFRLKEQRKAAQAKRKEEQALKAQQAQQAQQLSWNGHGQQQNAEGDEGDLQQNGLVDHQTAKGPALQVMKEPFRTDSPPTHSSPLTTLTSPTVSRAPSVLEDLPAEVSDTEFLPNEEGSSRNRHNSRKIPPTPKQYDMMYEQIWRDIARKDASKTYRTYTASLATKQSNFRKTAQLAAKEARRWQFRTNKNVKDLQNKAKRAMREMLVFWKRNERDEREHRRKAEKDAAEKAKKWEEQRETRRQARKLNFLITQTELYSHFIGRKIKTNEIEGSGTTTPSTQNLPELAAGPIGAKTSRLDDLDFDAEDDSNLQNAAIANAQHAIKEAQDRANSFNATDESMDLSNVNLDDGEMNFQNPTGLGDIDIEAPKMLVGQLKEYQLKGLNWLVNLYEQGINGILADEMGLGKTVQSIAVMAYLAEKHNIWGPFLVIAPASTLHNWQQEITKFAPSLKALPYWGNAKDRKILRKFWDRNKVTYDKDSPFHVLITSYQLVVGDAQYFSRVKWQYMILDEAQAIKSSNSSRWKSLLAFQCRNRLLLTGTPIQNSMQELWALLHFIMPSLFDSHDEFSEWFSKDIESHAQSNTQLNEQQLKRLHMILKPFMLRRVKKHVQKELGEKIELDLFCDLTYRQRAMYKGLREKISFLDLIEKAINGGDQDSQSLMNLVMQFRKVCNHPDLFERAEIHSPLFLGSFADTASFLREGPIVEVPYSTRNLLSYQMPKLVYRAGRLNAPGSNSNAGFRQKYLGKVMNIWAPDFIHESLSEGKSTFSWMRFVDASVTEVSRAFYDDIVKRALTSLQQPYQLYDGASLRRILLIAGTQQRFHAHAPMCELMNVGRKLVMDELLHLVESTYEPGAQVPPIHLMASDQGAIIEQQETLFDPGFRKMLMGPDKFDENRFVEQQVPPHEYPLPRLLPEPFQVNYSYSTIKVPAMSRFVTDSGKLAQLDRLLGELKANGHRVLLYFQMTRMIDLMEEYLSYRQYKYLRLDGSSKLADRRDMVDDWQTRDDLFIFLLSTRAGGLGINLTAADTVIFYDSDWNPTIDSQAMDRAHRLGQTKQVTVYRLITRGTIEERILKRAKQKEEVQKVVISGGDYKQQVDFNKGPREVAMWLLDDDEMEAKLRQRDAEIASGVEAKKPAPPGKGKKRKLGAAVLDGPADARTMEDMYHEGEGNFDDSGKPSEAATPTSTATPAQIPASNDAVMKFKGRSHKKKSAAEKLEMVGNM